MNDIRYPWLAPISRLLVAQLFLFGGLAKLLAPAATAGYIASGGLPSSPAFAVMVGAFEMVGGLGILLGYRTRLAAILLALFTVWATLVFHAYWAVAADAQLVQHLLFSKNIAVVGALLFLAAHGAGSWSIDNARGRVGHFPRGLPQ